jgi:hypothetical protein
MLEAARPLLLAALFHEHPPRRRPATEDIEREDGRTATNCDTQMWSVEHDLNAMRRQLRSEWLGERFITRCIKIDGENRR